MPRRRICLELRIGGFGVEPATAHTVDKELTRTCPKRSASRSDAAHIDSGHEARTLMLARAFARLCQSFGMQGQSAPGRDLPRAGQSSDLSVSQRGKACAGMGGLPPPVWVHSSVL